MTTASTLEVGRRTWGIALGVQGRRPFASDAMPARLFLGFGRVEACGVWTHGGAWVCVIGRIGTRPLRPSACAGRAQGRGARTPSPAPAGPPSRTPVRDAIKGGIYVLIRQIDGRCRAEAVRGPSPH